MKLLLDTHAFLWAMEDYSLLTKEAYDVITNGENIVYASVMNLWEISIKVHRGKLPLKMPLSKFLEESPFPFLPIAEREALAAGALEPYHKDPFDRMLVAQAMRGKLTIVTRDPHIPLYSVPTLRA